MFDKCYLIGGYHSKHFCNLVTCSTFNIFLLDSLNLVLKIYWMLCDADLFFSTGLDTIWAEKGTERKAAEKNRQSAEKVKVQREAPTDDDDDYEPKLTPGWHPSSRYPTTLNNCISFFVSKVFLFFSRFREWWWLQWSTWEWRWRIQSDKNQEERKERKSDQECENQTDSCLQKRQTSLQSIKVKITSSRFVVLVESRFVWIFFLNYFFNWLGFILGWRTMCSSACSFHTSKKSPSSQTCSQKTRPVLRRLRTQTNLGAEPGSWQGAQVDSTRYRVAKWHQPIKSLLVKRRQVKEHQPLFLVSWGFFFMFFRSNRPESHLIHSSSCQVSRSGSPTGTVPSGPG